ncbi:hypothetical protein OROGR_030367 [Orobanche gracilis]
MSFLGEVPSRSASIPHRMSFLPPCQERCVAVPIRRRRRGYFLEDDSGKVKFPMNRIYRIMKDHRCSSKIGQEIIFLANKAVQKQDIPPTQGNEQPHCSLHIAMPEFPYGVPRPIGDCVLKRLKLNEDETPKLEVAIVAHLFQRRNGIVLHDCYES